MRLAFLEHKFKLLDKCHVEILQKCVQTMGPDFRSVEELQKPQLDILAAGILITVNLESIAVDLETLSSKNMN